MEISFFKGMKPFSLLITTGFITVVVFMATQLAAMLLAIPVFGYQEVLDALTGPQSTDPGSIQVLKYFQVWQSIGLFILPAILIALLIDGKPYRFLRMDRPISLIAGLMVLVLVFAINPFINFTGSLNEGVHFPEWLKFAEDWIRRVETAAADLTQSFLETDTLTGLLFNLVMIAVLPAIGEELLFRGVLQKLLSDWTRSQHAGIWLAALLFSAMHMQFLGFIPRMLLGVVFGYLLVWSGSIWMPILAHFVNNAGAVMVMWLIDKEKLNPSVETIGSERGQWAIAVASLVTGSLLLILFKHSQVSSRPVKSQDPVMTAIAPNKEELTPWKEEP